MSIPARVFVRACECRSLRCSWRESLPSWASRLSRHGGKESGKASLPEGSGAVGTCSGLPTLSVSISSRMAATSSNCQSRNATIDKESEGRATTDECRSLPAIALLMCLANSRTCTGRTHTHTHAKKERKKERKKGRKEERNKQINTQRKKEKEISHDDTLHGSPRTERPCHLRSGRTWHATLGAAWRAARGHPSATAKKRCFSETLCNML